MSWSRQDPEPDPWRVDTVDIAVAERVEWDRHAHEDMHELLWGTRGTLTVETDDGWFAVPSALGIWIPAGVMHRVVAAPRTTFRCTYFDPALGSPGDKTTAVAMPELNQALLTRLADESRLPVNARRHAEQLVTWLLQPVMLTTVDLPLPSDDRTRRVAEMLLDDPADARSLDEWGREVGASARNLSRLFVAETGLSFAEWRTRARIRRAIEWLAADHSVVSVSARVGYATPSAFVQAFRREIGHTPGEFAGARSGIGQRLS
ncbi:helix-turn-helix domain-containing protein [Microbacterium allomyrinae]|uniref:HTH-type transcriptional regulator RipA n=1 Tax=Microbacterium allomyrinae TaxID=2830666 RepID=A0A9X1S268_9MICO|nr:AraC family transcriptional regulator [Microbacterium allomyrinae]MCC2030915.1 helix-turn-helix domain-containing protein [Microbacterium allomyrinae]